MTKNHSQPKPPSEDEDAVLGAIYSNEPDEALKRFTRGKHKDSSPIRGNRRRLMITITILVLLFGATAYLGFLLFSQPLKPSLKGVSVMMDIPDAVTSGEAATLTVFIRNDESVPLTDVELLLRYPDGFRPERSTWTADDEAMTTISIGSVLSETTETVAITGRIVGSIGDRLAFAGILRYIPANFSSVFEATTETSTAITKSLLDLTLEGPTTVVRNESVTYTVKLTNTSDVSIDNVRADFSLSDGFEVASIVPELTDTLWRSNGPFPSKAEQTFTITGAFTDQTSDTSEMSVVISLEKPGEIRQEQSRASVVIFLVNPNLSLTLTIDGQTSLSDDDGAILTADIDFRNVGETVIRDATVTVAFASQYDDGTFDTDLYDPSSVTAGDGGSFENGTVTWTPGDWADLHEVRPGASLGTDVAFRIADTLPAITDETHPRIALRATVTAEAIEDQDVQNIQLAQSGQLEVRVPVSPTFTALGRYYTDDLEQVGSGPLPPVVGETTRYRIEWAISTSANELQNVVVRGTVAPDAEWMGTSNIDAGEPIAYDPETRSVTWRLNAIPAHRQGDTAVHAWFDVAIAPQKGDVGYILELVSDIEMSGTDRFTERSVMASADTMTTEIPEDVKGRGNARVVEVTQ